MKTSVETTLTAVDTGYKAHPSGAVGIRAFGSTNDTAVSALNSPLYRTYCNLYEEVKLIGMRVQIAVSTQIGGAALPSLQIFTAWDRRHGLLEANYSGDQIKNSATYNVATALNNNIAKLTRSIYASDLMERAQWHDSKLNLNAGSYSDAAYAAAGNNPNFFSPAFFFSLCAPTLAQATAADLQVSVVYYMAFRNPKYGGSGEAAKVSSIPLDVQDLRGGSGDMDKDTGDVMVDDGDLDVDKSSDENIVLPPLPEGDTDDILLNPSRDIEAANRAKRKEAQRRKQAAKLMDQVGPIQKNVPKNA